MISVRNVTKKYKMYSKPTDRLKEALNPLSKGKHTEFYALKNVSFEIGQGETVGIIGKNGSGKSTLLKMITGIISPTEGSLDVKGKVSAILELGTGFNPEYTGLENIYMSGTIQGLTKEQIDAQLQDIIDFADIGDFIHQPFKTYSSGMQARLAFSVSIHVEPDVLIVDEALAVGDVKFNAKCMERFRQLKEKNVTILYVTHDVSSVRSFCDKAIWINEGELISYGDVVHITSAYLEYMHQDGKELKRTGVEPSLDGNVEIVETAFDPITRWGSRPELIKSVELFNQKGQKADQILFGETMTFSYVFHIPKDIDTKDLSAALAIKHSSGLDLLVSTTYDEGITFEKNDCHVRVEFEFTNYLNTGNYVVASSIEYRGNGEPEYFDFIEGSKYFQVVTNEKRYGLLNLPTKHNVHVLSN